MGELWTERLSRSLLVCAAHSSTRPSQDLRLGLESRDNVPGGDQKEGNPSLVRTRPWEGKGSHDSGPRYPRPRLLSLSLHPQDFLQGDCSKAKQKLNWKPRVAFDVSILFTVESVGLLAPGPVRASPEERGWRGRQPGARGGQGRAGWRPP